MTDEQGTSEGSPGLIQPWITRLRKITEELAGMTGLGETLFAPSIPALQGLPLPGAVSAAQLNAIASALAAQRSSIAALQAQLTAFDEQLAALEGILGPLAEWSKTWAEFERLVMNARHNPGTGRLQDPVPAAGRSGLLTVSGPTTTANGSMPFGELMSGGPHRAGLVAATVRGWEVQHACGAPPLVLRVELDGVSFAYSGGAQWTPVLAEAADGADLFAVEAYTFGPSAITWTIRPCAPTADSSAPADRPNPYVHRDAYQARRRRDARRVRRDDPRPVTPYPVTGAGHRP